MTLSNPPVHAFDLGELERQISEILSSSTPEGLDGRTAQVGRDEGIAVLDGHDLERVPSTASAALARGVSEQAGAGIVAVPSCSDEAFAANGSKNGSHSASRGLALVVPFLVLAGVGATLLMRGEPGSKPPEVSGIAKQTPFVAAYRMPSQSALGAPVSSTDPDQLVNVALPKAAQPQVTLIPAALSMPMLPEPPKRAAEGSPTFGARSGVVETSGEPGATMISEAKLEAAPLPPRRPSRLAFAETPMVIPPAKQSDVSPNGSGGSSFSIQLASSRSKSEALASLSRLKKLFPGVLGGASVRRADLGGNGVLYRVLVGPLTRDAADKACSQLRTSGEKCMVARG